MVQSGEGLPQTAQPEEGTKLTDTRPLPERLFAAGVVDLIPVIPPGATLTPSSTIDPSSLGKSPGIRTPNGLWSGTDWRSIQTTAEDVKTWLRWGANIGLRTDRYPCVDIDIADPTLADIVEQAALAQLGPAPIRTGNAPKRALAYRTDTPFGKLKLLLQRDGKQFLVEILGAGQQYLVHGTHPKTLLPYSWDREPTGELTPITLAQAEAFLAYLVDATSLLGYDCKRVGDGSRTSRRADQASLEAPSIDELRKAVELIPNDLERFPGWDEYIKMLHAVRAAAGPDEEDGLDIFAAWAAKWEGHGIRHEDSDDPDAVRALWRRTHGPFSLGWPWVAELAREHGYEESVFEADDAATTPTPAEASAAVGPEFLSDQWLAVKVVKAARGVLRYVPAKEIWLVWNKGRWQPDAEMLAEDIIKIELRKIAAWRARQSDKGAIKDARDICSSGKLTAVMRLVKSDRAIAVAPESLDVNPWIINTPGGVVDLKTGKMIAPDPDQLCTRSTAVTPEPGPAPVWTRFLHDATNGDVELQAYLKRLMGYCLTGVTIEQQFTFIHGGGGNGKGKFLDVLMGIMGTYHRDSPMDTFVASNNERHPTELAYLAGARLVTASETDAGRRWDEARLKRMTGGDPITARGMREDFFTYLPQFKLVFIGNHRPEIRNLDDAIRRRTHLVPFTHKPPVIDKFLGDKLREEWPAILAWMIEGCLEWQGMLGSTGNRCEGLLPPPIVQAATEEYFVESDPMGQWLKECTAPASAETWTSALDLFESWQSWAKRRGEFPGRIQRFSSMLGARKYQKRQNPSNRRAEFAGITITGQNQLEGLVAE